MQNIGRRKCDDTVMMMNSLQTTQSTNGGAITAVTNCCANCVETFRPQQWGLIYRFWAQAGNADPLFGWYCPS